MLPHRSAALAAVRAALMLFLISKVLASGEPLAAVAKRDCHECGGVDIPYPFGVRSSGCAMAPDYEVDCNETSKGVYKPFVSRNVEVLKISLQIGQARVMNHISSSCYNNISQTMDPPDEWYLNLTGTAYRLSDSANKFTVIGCRTLAYIADESYVGKYMSGCVSVCRRGDLRNAINGTCTGIGCCQTNIRTNLDYYQIVFEVGSLNTSGIYNMTPCSYAVLMDSSNFTFSTAYLTSTEFNTTYGGQAPLVLDWAIRTANSCEEAQKNFTSYACKANTFCLNSTNGPGYLCNCKKGYQGNPYLQGPNGCQASDSASSASDF
uniref:Wall-associated receptor kinase galacturonan-binding domain-containing protein n=1 Tax=Leersia perrieri TaxID=77586 RepID=A0A0D9W3X9_9ORYZ